MDQEILMLHLAMHAASDSYSATRCDVGLFVN